jgi:hypothetical protein
MRDRALSLAQDGSIAAAVVFAFGLSVMLTGAQAYGDWYLIRQPWAALGMTSIVLGLAVAWVLGVLRVVLEPPGWPTAVALAGVVLSGFFWVAVLTMPLFGACCDQPGFPRNAGDILYSAPGLMIPLVISTALMHIPFIGRRPAFGWRR